MALLDDSFKVSATSFISCHSDWYVYHDDSAKLIVFKIDFDKVAGSIYISRSLMTYHGKLLLITLLFLLHFVTLLKFLVF